MITSFGRISFKNEDDIINYVTKGLAPSPEDYQKLKESIQDNTVIKLKNPEDDVIKLNISPEKLDLIYQNKRRNENIAMIIGGIAILIAGVIGFKLGTKSQSKHHKCPPTVINLNDPDIIEILEGEGFVRGDRNDGNIKFAKF